MSCDRLCVSCDYLYALHRVIRNNDRVRVVDQDVGNDRHDGMIGTLIEECTHYSVMCTMSQLMNRNKVLVDKAFRQLSVMRI